MNPRDLTVWIARRATKALAVVALALGVAATALAPTAAHAGPLNPKPGPSLTPDLVTSIIPGDPKLRLTEIQFTAVMKNQGSLTARGVRMRVTLPDGFTNIKISPGVEQSCTIEGNSVTCVAQSLDGGQYGSVNIKARTPATIGSYTVTSTIDPDNFVRESKEYNNVGTGTLLVI